MRPTVYKKLADESLKRYGKIDVERLLVTISKLRGGISSLAKSLETTASSISRFAQAAKSSKLKIRICFEDAIAGLGFSEAKQYFMAREGETIVSMSKELGVGSSTVGNKYRIFLTSVIEEI